MIFVDIYTSMFIVLLKSPKAQKSLNKLTKSPKNRAPEKVRTVATILITRD